MMTGLLLDTNILLPLLDTRKATLPAHILARLRDADTAIVASVASIWEIAIKNRLGKLPLPWPVSHLPVMAEQLGISIWPILSSHAVAELDPWPKARDPFDRLLLATCAVDDLKLVTVDRLLADHPLAWRA